jgi:hypothetical protein
VSRGPGGSAHAAGGPPPPDRSPAVDSHLFPIRQWLYLVVDSSLRYRRNVQTPVLKGRREPDLRCACARVVPMDNVVSKMSQVMLSWLMTAGARAAVVRLQSGDNHVDSDQRPSATAARGAGKILHHERRDD